MLHASQGFHRDFSLSPKRVFTSVQAKKNYEQKCREHDSCEETLKKSASQQSKDEEKVSWKI